MRASQLPWPDTYLAPAAWPAIRRLVDRCLTLDASSALPGALMMVGEAGVGREAAAVELAAGLVCRASAGSACQCNSCERVRRGVHPDIEQVGVLPGKTLISIEQIRDVVGHASQLPFEGRRRVCVLASGQTPPLGAEAASALLKTLEEPPGHLTFVLLVSSPTRVLTTIVSRCVQIRVPRPTAEELLALVAEVHRCGRDRARELLAAWNGDAGLAVRCGDEISPESLTAERELLRKAVAGDGLAILQAANASSSQSAGIEAAVTALAQLACADSGEIAEATVDAARALLQAERRSAVLNLDLESVVVGTLAALASERQS